jgi:hypothetical protein
MDHRLSIPGFDKWAIGIFQRTYSALVNTEGR